MVRKRRMIKRFQEEQKEKFNLSTVSSESSKKSEERFRPDLLQCKGIDVETIIQAEAGFFCDVLQRLSKEIKCARDLDDLDNIITLASKFLHASAAKEKSIAYQISASKGSCLKEHHISDCDTTFADSNLEDSKSDEE